MTSTPTPFDECVEVTLYRVPTNVTIPAGWQYVYRDKYAMVSLCFATAAYPPEERVASGSYWTFEPVPAPPLPTKPGAVIANVKTYDGETFSHAYLADPKSDSVRWEAPGYARGGWTAKWLADEDIASFEVAFEGIEAIVAEWLEEHP